MARPVVQNRTLKNKVLVGSALLVVASIVGTYLVIEQSKLTDTFLIAKTNLPSGTPLTEELFGRVELSMFAAGEKYLSPEVSLPSTYLIRPVSAGELVPLSAISSQQLDDFANLVITPSLEPSSNLLAGSRVSLWSSPRLDYQSFGDPILLALDVEVVSISKPQGGFSGDLESVEVRVPIESVPYLLRSVANGDSLALVGSGESLGG